MDALQQDICGLSGLLFILQHWNHRPPWDLGCANNVSTDTDVSRLYECVAEVLGTEEHGVAVTGRRSGGRGLHMIVATSEHSQMHRSFVSPEVPDIGSLATFVPRLYSILRNSMVTGDFASLTSWIIERRQGSILQAATASDTLFVADTSFRDILETWRPQTSDYDLSLLPKHGVKVSFSNSATARLFCSWFLSKDIPDGSRSVVLITLEDTRWLIKSLGMMLRTLVEVLERPDSVQGVQLSNHLMYLNWLWEIACQNAFEDFWRRSSLAKQLAQCYYRYLLNLDQANGATFDLCPLPEEVYHFTEIPDIRKLITKYVVDVLATRTAASYIPVFMRATRDPGIMFVHRVFYVYTGDSETTYRRTYMDVLHDFLKLGDERDQIWLPLFVQALQKRVSGSIHPSAALVCLQHSDPHDPMDSVDADTGDALSNLDGMMGTSHKICYCCYLFRLNAALYANNGKWDDDDVRTHGRVTPWLPPVQGVHPNVLWEIRKELVELLGQTVEGYRKGLAA